MPSDYDGALTSGQASVNNTANAWSNSADGYGVSVNDALTAGITKVSPFANSAQTADGGFISAGGPPISGGIKGISWGCGQCPDFVLGVLVDDCRDTLQRVRQVKTTVSILNRLITDAGSQLLSDLRALLALIPLPPMFDLSAIVRMLTCPLTPQAILVQQLNDVLAYAERAAASATNPAQHAGLYWPALTTYTATAGSLLATLDPRALVNRIVKLIQSYIRQLRLLIDTFLEEMKGAAYVQLINRYVREFYHAVNSADALVLKIMLTSVSVAGVRATCPDIFNRDDLPFKMYTETMVGFTFDGVLPSGLSDNAKELVLIFAQIEAKLAMWQAASLVLLV